MNGPIQKYSRQHRNKEQARGAYKEHLKVTFLSFIQKHECMQRLLCDKRQLNTESSTKHDAPYLKTHNSDFFCVQYFQTQ